MVAQAYRLSEFLILHQLWNSYIKRPMILVGPSLGAAVAIDFAVHYPEAVSLSFC